MALNDYFERLANISGEGARATDFTVMKLQREKAMQDFVKNIELQKQRNLQFNAYAPPGQQVAGVSNQPGGNFNGKLGMYPLKGDYRISSNFGGRTHPISGKHSNHTGIDWAAPAGTPIYAPAGGTARTRFNKIYGNQTILDLGGGRSLMFGHQSGFNVKSGSRVAQGQLIGYVGSTGWSTGPHLHFETWYNNKPVNPLSWFQ
jgi:murein DD-endopeptidase MepM/ murein hydrolase activator NlpD